MNKTEGKMPNEKVMSLIAEAAADKVRDKLLYDLTDVVHGAITDAVEEVLGTSAYEGDEDAYMEMLMELSGRISVVAL